MYSQRLPYLIHAIAHNSDEQAFEELFRIYYPALLSYTASLLKDNPVAEEICGDVLFNLWQNRKTLPAIKNLSHYLYISAKHAAISYTRSRGYKESQKNISLGDVGETLTYELSNHELRLINKETLKEINLAINELPDRCRLIFKLIKEDGLKYAEVARLLEISVKTVENQMTIAVKKLSGIIDRVINGYKRSAS
ncbi:RNA polymerase sigma-70 factor [Niabella sp. CJ426]|jgi:RNA polymerase sigma-70 factor (family 1)|uniref:RNA polymerase sigma-70 factor n=1 Tax=Niabella sp. CJ426 TaxID=3393740 RepID=UPI003D064FC1